MKKIYILILILAMQTSACFAMTNLRVKMQEDFTTANAPENINLEVVKNAQLGEYELHSGDILECALKVKPPRRGKRNAVFYVQPSTIISGEEQIEVTKKMRGRYTKIKFSKEDLKQVDKGKIATKTAIKAGEYFAKNMTPAISIAEGMIKNEEGNRLKSGAVQVYKDSPFSYLSKGKQITLKENEEFYILFKTKKVKNKKQKIEEPISEEESAIEETPIAD